MRVLITMGMKFLELRYEPHVLFNENVKILDDKKRYASFLLSVI